MEFQQARGMEISCAVERMVLPGGSNLGKNETYDPDPLIIHDTAVCLHFRQPQPQVVN